MKYLLPLILLASSAAAQAAGKDVILASNVFVERVKQDPTGKRATVLEPPRVVTPGDKLVFELSYRNRGAEPASDFVVTNPIPDAVAFDGTESEFGVVSTDGGYSWGKLAALKVKQADGTLRPAQPSDVTHVRWTFTRAIAAGEAGKLSFRGVVK
jgi:uncharacterized repeat protein (TIGR01451 family)